MNNEDYYSTSDLALAATLLSSGFKLNNLQRNDSRRVLFIFARDLGIDETLDDYWKDLLRVNPKSYFDAIKHLKTRLYSVA